MKLDPLTFSCPQCRALAGQKCRNYTGRGCAPHRERTARAWGERVPARLAEALAKTEAAAAAGLFDDLGHDRPAQTTFAGRPAAPVDALTGRRLQEAIAGWPAQALAIAIRHGKRQRWLRAPACECGACSRARADGWVDVRRER
jgi:hypothetical protein